MQDQPRRAAITAEEALAIARARAAERGWRFGEPARVTRKRDWLGRVRSFHVVANPSVPEVNPRFAIDARTGAITMEAYVPR